MEYGYSFRIRHKFLQSYSIEVEIVTSSSTMLSRSILSTNSNRVFDRFVRGVSRTSYHRLARKRRIDV
ncbi:hypothetical protein RB195_021386 [Necator americanus]|uniref:Uncharacterized protein n=1 Tax=Necator americanus TaxID=51031 RepID=A0ABR1EAQ9_NECAM